MKHKVYEIVWEDVVNSGGWKSIDAARTQKGGLCVAVGILINTGPKYTRIAMGYMPAMGEDDVPVYGAVETIPTQLIKKKKFITEIEFG